MYKNILIPVAPDHSTSYKQALAMARKLVAQDGKITALTVLEAIPDFVRSQVPSDIYEGRAAEAEGALKADLGDSADIEPVVVSGHSYRTILDYAHNADVDCIIITSHKPEFSDYLIGSTAARVVRHAKCCVVVLR
ncbi:universal stress protein [Cognatishimia maritima]|uniref:Nucleotide-binding universal stress protein, UspA family n=1 Tax=Cognatishimia maritima TaxID=870908 RepID=A0A1M5V2Y8_9RHOB|nr:universal stress protein [Cognatishimia maritima]SHH69576.1 Nucleotide-binding universal stress protein, UspA family [Cognatishimia maritima]